MKISIATTLTFIFESIQKFKNKGVKLFEKMSGSKTPTSSNCLIQGGPMECQNWMMYYPMPDTMRFKTEALAYFLNQCHAIFSYIQIETYPFSQLKNKSQENISTSGYVFWDNFIWLEDKGWVRKNEFLNSISTFLPGQVLESFFEVILDEEIKKNFLKKPPNYDWIEWLDSIMPALLLNKDSEVLRVNLNKAIPVVNLKEKLQSPSPVKVKRKRI